MLTHVDQGPIVCFDTGNWPRDGIRGRSNKHSYRKSPTGVYLPIYSPVYSHPDRPVHLRPNILEVVAQRLEYNA